MKCSLGKLVYIFKPFWFMYLPLKWTIRKASLWDSASCMTFSNLSATWLTKHLPKIQNKPLYFPSNNYFGAPVPFEIIPILLSTNLRRFLSLSLLNPLHLDIYPKCSTNICSFSGFSYVITLASSNIQLHSVLKQHLLDLLMTLGTTGHNHLI